MGSCTYDLRSCGQSLIVIFCTLCLASGCLQQSNNPATESQPKETIQDSLQPTPQMAGPAKRDSTLSAWVKVATANIRCRPDTRSEIVAKVKMGERVELKEETSGWWSVIVSDSISGYMRADLITRNTIHNVNPIPTTFAASYNNTLIDIDGNSYKIVRIGSQWWMAENMKVMHYRNGDAIPNVSDNMAWKVLSTGARCAYDNNAVNIAAFGQLYNWYAVNDSRNIAPAGWHVPSDAEWQTLADYLGGDAVAGGKLKESGSKHWDNPDTGATNESGFSAIPGGYRSAASYFMGMGAIAIYWTSTEKSDDTAWDRRFYPNDLYITRASIRKVYGYSVRCVRD